MVECLLYRTVNVHNKVMSCLMYECNKPDDDMHELSPSVSKSCFVVLQHIVCNKMLAGLKASFTVQSMVTPRE